MFYHPLLFDFILKFHHTTMEQLGLPVVSHELLDVPDRQLGDRGEGLVTAFT